MTVRRQVQRMVVRSTDGARCPMCLTPYIHPACLKKEPPMPEVELDVLRVGAALNRVCLACGGVFRIVEPRGFYSIEGFDPDGDPRLLPLDAAGGQMRSPKARAILPKTLERIHRKWVAALRKAGYSVGEISEKLEITNERVAKILTKGENDD